jgi:hypothetical protein
MISLALALFVPWRRIRASKITKTFLFPPTPSFDGRSISDPIARGTKVPLSSNVQNPDLECLYFASFGIQILAFSASQEHGASPCRNRSFSDSAPLLLLAGVSKSHSSAFRDQSQDSHALLFPLRLEFSLINPRKRKMCQANTDKFK